MTQKHSPGPWTAEPAYHSSPVDLLNPEPDYWYIDGPGNDVYGTMSAADAYLIAAAPELLEALQAVVKVADRATVEFDAARAAIAQATKVWTP